MGSIFRGQLSPCAVGHSKRIRAGDGAGSGGIGTLPMDHRGYPCPAFPIWFLA
jgi:hypothetical protein